MSPSLSQVNLLSDVYILLNKLFKSLFRKSTSDEVLFTIWSHTLPQPYLASHQAPGLSQSLKVPNSHSLAALLLAKKASSHHPSGFNVNITTLFQTKTFPSYYFRESRFFSL